MPASALKRIAILVESSRAFGRGLTEGIASYAARRGDWLLQYHEGTLDFDLRAWLAHWRGDGILARIARESDAEILAASGIPTVDLLGEIRHPAIASVDVNNESVARMAVRHFIDAGFTQIAFCGYPGIAFSDARQEIFERVAREESLAVFGYQLHAGQTGTISRREQWRPHREGDIAAWLASLPRPVAIFACNDVRALDVSTACRLSGVKVPEDAAILGVDNDALICGMSRPSLSSIQPDVIRQGARGAEILEEMLSANFRRPPPAENIPPLEVVERPSTDIVAFSDPVVAEAVRHIRKHGLRNIGTQQVAEAVGVSASHLNRLFKQATGRTINKELQRVRLVRIRHLLRHSDLTLGEIARQTGFSTAANLSKFFKSKEGLCPGAFRSASSLLRPQERTEIEESGK